MRRDSENMRHVGRGPLIWPTAFHTAQRGRRAPPLGLYCGFVTLEQCRATISGVGGLSNGTGGIGQKVTLTRSDMITF